MGLFMRFFSTSEQPIDLGALDAALREIDPKYSVLKGTEPGKELALLAWKKDPHGDIEVNRPGDGLFDEEIAETKQFVAEARGDRKQEVLDVLERTRFTFAVQVIWMGRHAELTLRRIDPVWGWVFKHYEGMLHVDGEGFYDRSGLVLEMK